MTTGVHDDALEDRTRRTAFIYPVIRVGELGSSQCTEQDGNVAGKKHRIRAEGRLRTSLGSAGRKEILNKYVDDCNGKVKNGTKAAVTLYSRDVARVRADTPLARDSAEPPSQEGSIWNQRDDRKEEGLKLCEEYHRTNDLLQDASTSIVQEVMSRGQKQFSQVQQQQSPQVYLQRQGPLVRWESFLPRGQLRVLLVEDDDSTRHIVSALLRNCSYEVTSTASGLLAWELLVDQTNRIDLILTEVIMPGLSGIGLLARIMSNEACKHIPVIMMSTHDSMGIVFKCLSKGAVDFLVKPVRKNELKNLWQHVWRRCQTSSGSRSQTQKVAQFKGAADDDSSCSNDESDNVSSDFNARGGSDNGSGTQSSWTKNAVEVESSQLQTNQNSSYPNDDSVPHAQKHTENVQADQGTSLLFEDETDGKVGLGHAVGHDVQIAMSKLAKAETTYLHKVEGHSKSACTMLEAGELLEENTRIHPLREYSRHAIDLNGVITDEAKSREQGEQEESEDGHGILDNHASHSPSSKNKTVSGFNSPPLLELTLRSRHIEEDNKDKGCKRILRYSCSSAFSRYNSGSKNTLMPPGSLPNINNCKPGAYVGNSFLHGSSVGSSNPSIPLSAQIERATSSNGGADVIKPSPFDCNLHCVNNKQDSSLPHIFAPGKEDFETVIVKEEALPLGMPMTSPLPPALGYDGLSTACGLTHHPVFFSQGVALHWGFRAPVAERGKTDDPQTNHQTLTPHHSGVHSHHHHLHIQHHYYHHHQNLAQQEDRTVTNVAAGTPRCGSSNMTNGPEGNHNQSGSCNGNGNGSMNGSTAGSNNGHSNGQSAAALGARGSGDSDTQPGNGESGAENVLMVTNNVLSDPGQNRFASREAALTKFRQKRKERCFEKKVRYQSRKKLAEQRPRLRGQFVRQSVYDSVAGEPD